MKFFVTVLFCFLSQLSIFSQSRKEIKDAGIKERIEHSEVIDGGMSSKFIESVEKYDTLGNLIEKKEMNDKGDIVLYERYQYSPQQKLCKELVVDPVTNQETKITSYEYNNDGKLIKETILNKKGEVIKSHAYTYENNLKNTRTTTNAKGKIIEVKTYQYILN
jgi:hypothetical protein